MPATEWVPWRCPPDSFSTTPGERFGDEPEAAGLGGAAMVQIGGERVGDHEPGKHGQASGREVCGQCPGGHAGDGA
jgi:hypothetical protein